MIDENGDALGVLSNFEAKKLAQEKGLDLIEISPNMAKMSIIMLLPN